MPRGDRARSRYNLAMHLRVRSRKSAAIWMIALMAIATALVLFESACTMFKEHPANSFADATGGEGLERVFWKSVAAGNFKEIDRVLASNYAGVTPSGTLDKAAALEQYQNWRLKQYSLGDLKTELNGTTMVVTYTITLNGSIVGKGGTQALPSTPQPMMSVWQQEKSGWIEVAHSASLP